jgi:coenzyme Q-binding protein COQ10
MLTHTRISRALPSRRRRFAEGAAPGSCEVDFSVALRVNSPLHAHALHLFFADVAERQISAFEDRCRHVYTRR